MPRKRLLLVSSRLERGAAGLEDVEIETDQLHVLTVGSIWDARRALLLDSDIEVVLTDPTLKDGNWCDLLRLLTRLGVSADFHVMTEQGSSALDLEVESRGGRVVHRSLPPEQEQAADPFGAGRSRFACRPREEGGGAPRGEGGSTARWSQAG